MPFLCHQTSDTFQSYRFYHRHPEHLLPTAPLSSLLSLYICDMMSKKRLRWGRCSGCLWFLPSKYNALTKWYIRNFSLRVASMYNSFIINLAIRVTLITSYSQPCIMITGHCSLSHNTLLSTCRFMFLRKSNKGGPAILLLSFSIEMSHENSPKLHKLYICGILRT